MIFLIEFDLEKGIPEFEPKLLTENSKLLTEDFRF